MKVKKKTPEYDYYLQKLFFRTDISFNNCHNPCFMFFFNCPLNTNQLLELFRAQKGSFQRNIITLLVLFIIHNILSGLENPS